MPSATLKLALVALCCLAMHHSLLVESSAIPMWEYLSRDEKMSYLFSMFANQVDDFCEFSDMNNCNKELLSYGLKKLKVMPEDHLDNMDPYQRGAHTIIWGSMMDGHEMMQTTTTTTPQPSAGRRTNTPYHRQRQSAGKPNSYDDPTFQRDYATVAGGGDEFEAAASQTHGSIYQVVVPPPPSTPAAQGGANSRRPGVHYVHPDYATIKAGIPQYRAPPNKGYQQQQSQSKSSYSYSARPVGQSGGSFRPVYIPLNGDFPAVPIQDGNMLGMMSRRDDVRDVPLTGPMVVRVHLDGTPVRNSGNTGHDLHEDEDLRQYHMSKAQLPAF